MAKQVRRLNKRFVTFLTIGIMVVLTLAIGILIMATRHKDPKVYGTLGDTCMAKGEYEEAARNYLKAYNYSGKDPSWLLKTSEANYAMGDIKYAMGALQSAVTVNPTLVEARERLVKLYWEIGGRGAPASLAKQMEEEADKLIKIIPEKSVATNPELKKALAMGYHVRGVAKSKRIAEDPTLAAQAKEDIQKAISLDPDPEYVQSLAAMSLENAQQMVRMAASATISPESFDEYIRKMNEGVSEAEKIYLQLAKVSKGSSDAFVKLGDFYFQMWGRLEKAVAMFCSAQETRLQNSIMTAEDEMSKVEASKEGSAETRRRALQRLRNSIVDSQSQIPQWKERAGDHNAKYKQCNDRALEYYKQAMTLAKDKDAKVTAESSLANYYLTNENMKEAEGLIRQAIADDPKGYSTYRLFAMVMKQKAGDAKDKEGEKYIDEAITMLNHRVYEMPHDFGGVKGRLNRYQRADLMSILAEFYMDRQKAGDLAKADQTLKDLEVDVGTTPIFYQLKASRAIADKDYTTAIMLLEKADKLNNGTNPSVKMILAELYSRTGNLGAAKTAVMAGLSLQPGTYGGLRMAMLIDLRLGENEEALRFADSILKVPAYAKDKSALAVKLECLSRLNRMDDADKVARVLEKEGANLDWPVQKARLLLREGKTSEAEELLKGALAKEPGQKAATAFLVELYLRQNAVDQAGVILKSALAKHPDDKDLKRLEVLLAISDPKERLAKMQEISKQMADESMSDQMTKAKEEKDPFKKAVMLYDQYVQRNDLETAKKYLDEAVKLDPKKANELNFRFSLLKKDWSRAQGCADLAKTNNLDSFNGLRYEAEMANARGWDALTAGKDGEAKNFFEQSARAAEQIVKQMPNDSQSRAILGEAYWWLDRRAEGATQISKSLELSPSNPYALRASCVMQWEGISAGTTTDSATLSGFANNLQNAFQQMPWDSWLKDRMEWLKATVAKQREYVADDKDDAAKVVERREKVRKDHPKDVDNLIRLARVYEVRKEVSDPDKAEACYKQALEEKPGSEVLRMYAAFAERNKRTGHVEAFLKTLAEKDGKAGKGQGYTLLGYYYLLARNSASAEWAFTEAVKAEDTAAKRMDLAIFYGQTGNPAKAAEWARKTLAAKPEGPLDKRVRSMLITSLIQMQQWKEAGEEVQQYQKAYEKDPQGRIFAARLAMEQGKLSEAEGILTQLLTESPEYVEALDMRSLVYQYTWQLEKSQADLEKLREVNSRAFGIVGQIRLTKLYCEMAKTSEADRQARALIESAKGQPGEYLEMIRQQLLPSLSSALEPTAYDDLLIWAANMYQGYWGWMFERGQYDLMQLRYSEASRVFSQAWDSVAKSPAPLKLMILNSYLESLYKSKSYKTLLSTAAKATSEFKGSTSQIMSWEAAANYAEGEGARGSSLFEKVLATEKEPLMVWQLTRKTILTSVSAKELISALEKVPAGSGNPQNVQMAMACAYFATDNLAQGDAIYRKLAANAKDAKEKAVYLYMLGQEYTEKRKYPEAVKAFEESNAQQGDNLAVVNNIAYLLEEYLGKPDDALKAIGRIFVLAPNNADVLDTYGQVMMKLGRTEEALYYTAKSVLIQESGASRYHLGMILLSQNRRTDAAIQFRRALQLVGEDKALEKQVREGLGKV